MDASRIFPLSSSAACIVCTALAGILWGISSSYCAFGCRVGNACGIGRPGMAGAAMVAQLSSGPEPDARRSRWRRASASSLFIRV